MGAGGLAWGQEACIEWHGKSTFSCNVPVQFLTAHGRPSSPLMTPMPPGMALRLPMHPMHLGQGRPTPLCQVLGQNPCGLEGTALTSPLWPRGHSTHQSPALVAQARDGGRERWW